MLKLLMKTLLSSHICLNQLTQLYEKQYPEISIDRCSEKQECKFSAPECFVLFWNVTRAFESTSQ